jgi:long-chain fatty acid transport protein
MKERDQFECISRVEAMRAPFFTRLCMATAVAVALFGPASAHAQFGIVLSGAGPNNRSMGGASTAAPLDASGAMYWNPAGITGLQGSEIDVGLEALYPRARLSSSLPANTFGPGFPPIALSGSDHSDSGAFLLPTVGVVYQPCESPFVFGVGIFAAGGFAVNYPGSATNPVLTPQPPVGLGLGPVSAELQVYQIVPTVAYSLTDHLSVGIAPTLSLARLNADPAFLAPPDNANGDGFATFTSATHGRLEAGGGLQAGVFYTTDMCWHFGASIKTPQWFETFRYNSTDQLGRPRELQFHFNYPLIASIGTSYTGFAGWVLAADFRYIDYANTVGFSQTGFDPTTGAVRGLGWDSVFAAAFGAQYELSPCCSVRVGYTFNTNPIRDDKTMFNVASPMILENTIYLGASYKLTPTFSVSVAYAHAFENSVQGEIETPFGTIPGSTVQSNVSADTFMIGATVKF